MQLNSLFDDLSNIKSKSTQATTDAKIPDSKIPDSKITDSKITDPKIPIRESTTLNQLLYTNERYNKRNIPVNVDKKPFHEIMKSNDTSMVELDAMIDKDISKLMDKAWFQIPIKMKTQLIQEYCEKNDITITDDRIKVIVKDRTLVKYIRKEHRIQNIKI